LRFHNGAPVISCDCADGLERLLQSVDPYTELTQPVLVEFQWRITWTRGASLAGRRKLAAEVNVIDLLIDPVRLFLHLTILIHRSRGQVCGEIIERLRELVRALIVAPHRIQHFPGRTSVGLLIATPTIRIQAP
jgi:hypothetical protein